MSIAVKAEAEANESFRRLLPGRFDVVAIGSSAGGLHSLTEVLGRLSAEFPCSILVVQHLHPNRKSMMAELLARVTSIHVKEAEDGERLRPGTAYIAPPDQHLLAEAGLVKLAHSQVVRWSRPSVDLLFESVAESFGARSIGVILSGSLRDGAAGIRKIKNAGGSTIVEDPKRAEFKSMPQAAIATGCIDYVISLNEIGAALGHLCNGSGPQ